MTTQPLPDELLRLVEKTKAKAVVKLTYNELHKLSEHGRLTHGWSTYPVQLVCKTLVELGISGRLEIYPNNNDDGDGLPDVIYTNITTAAEHGNTAYKQKGIDYCASYPIAKKKRSQA